MKVLRLAMVLVLGASLVACNPFRRSKPAPTPPPAPKPRPVALPPQVTEIPPPPSIEGGAQSMPPANEPKISVKPPVERPTPRRTQKKTPPVEVPTPTPPPPTAPQLRPVLTLEEQRQLNSAIDARLARARAALQRATQNSGVAQQVRTFIAQCEEARRIDLIRAAALAERADLLAREIR